MAENKKTDGEVERELFAAVFNTPKGRELIQLWERRLTTVKVYAPDMTEAQCRFTSGKQSLMIDIIKTIRGKNAD